MKKIVGILSAAAVLAASVFAADVSAGVRLEGSLFNFDAATKKVTALSEKHNNEFYHAPISFAISDDKAGGQLKLTDKAGNDVLSDAWSIWIKPIDQLKVTVGRWSTNLNQEHIGWCNTDSGIESDGYALSLGIDAFSMDLFFASGNGNAWFTKEDGVDPVLKELYLKVQYGADFGTINAMFNTINNFKDFRFGAGYNAKGLPVGLWVNVIGTYAAEEFQRLRVEADVSGSIESIGYEVFLAGGYNFATNVGAMNAFTGVEGWHKGGSYYLAEPAAFLGLMAKVNIPLDAIRAYVQIEAGDLIAKNFSMLIKPGMVTNIGACEFEAALAFTAQEKIVIDVPVSFKVSF